MITELIYCESDWKYVNEKTDKIIIHYNVKNWPKLPKNLKELYCNYNRVEYLPELPSKLITLYCHNNLLRELPELPNILNYLDCSSNLLTNITDISLNLKVLHCYNNPLERLPNGITKSFVNDLYRYSEYFKQNVIKWINNEPSHYDLLKIYLTKEQKNYFNREFKLKRIINEC